MNPFLATGLILIFRWFQHLGSRGILDNTTYLRNFDKLMDDTQAYNDRLTKFTLTSVNMIDNSEIKGKVQ